MNSTIYKNYVGILKNELIVALGCTEPIAIAFGAAKAREILAEMPTSCIVTCSGNIVKNVMGVTVPNSGGLKGVAVAAVLGIVGGDASRELAVLEDVKEEDIQKTKELLDGDFCTTKLEEGIPGLYISVYVASASKSAEVILKDYHTQIVKILKNNEVIFEKKEEELAAGETEWLPNKELLNVQDILSFAESVEIEDIRPYIERQIECNTAISKEGLERPYGVQVGRSLMNYPESGEIHIRAKAAAAAGSDARMSGCPLPVVINSGSGNQGITVTMPVIEYAKELGASEEKLFRALVISNLISVHQKKYIGNLSAYCGAVSAACGSGVGIGYLLGFSYDQLCHIITNTIGTIGGMVCDGAKPSCAAKIASAVDAALLSLQLSKNHLAFQPGEGLIKKNIEDTIRSIGQVGREGMRETDVEILMIMLEK